MKRKQEGGEKPKRGLSLIGDGKAFFLSFLNEITGDSGDILNHIHNRLC